jgi:hypothetical protein
MLEVRGRTFRLLPLVAAAFVSSPVCLISDPARSKPKRIAARPAPSPRKTPELLGNLPLVFEANLGQTDPQVCFLTRASGIVSAIA